MNKAKKSTTSCIIELIIIKSKVRGGSRTRIMWDKIQLRFHFTFSARASHNLLSNLKIYMGYPNPFSPSMWKLFKISPPSTHSLNKVVALSSFLRYITFSDKLMDTVLWHILHRKIMHRWTSKIKHHVEFNNDVL